ncbi:hypothetical protein ACT453_57785, partial [Bacillus sp. D-CC]
FNNPQRSATANSPFPSSSIQPIGAQAGLGYFSKRMMTQLDGAGVFAPIVLLSLLAIFFVILISVLEKKFISWRKHS